MIAGTLAWIAGVIGLQLYPELPSLHWLWLTPLPLVALRTSGVFRLPAIVVLGALWSLLDAHWTLDDCLPAHLENTNIVVVGTVKGLPERDGTRLRFLFRVEELKHGGISYPAPGLVRLSWYKPTADLAPQEQWQLRVRLKLPRGFSNPGGFDYEGWLYRHRIRATGYVRADAINHRLPDTGWSPSIDRLRLSVVKAQREALSSHAFGGLVRALTVGDRSAVSPEQWQLLRKTGTTHLLAISGLHVGIFAGLAFLLTRVMWASWPALGHRVASPRAAACVALLAAMSYAALAGFSLPTQRALIMVAVFMLGLFLRRVQRPLHSFAIALFIVSALDPKATLSPGFWLSFGAVAVILAGTLGHRSRHNGWRWVEVQWIVALGLAPLLIGFFGQVSLVAPLANLIAIPWIGFAVLPLALLGTLAVILMPTLGETLLNIAAWLLQGLLQLLGTFSHWPFSHWSVPELPGYLLLVALIGIVLLIAPRGIPGRPMGLLLIAPLVWYPGADPPPVGAFRVALLDVGQGLSVVVRTHTHTMVYDSGPRFSDRFDAGQAVVVPYLKSRGISRVDRLVISHGDNDHSGGVAAVRRLTRVVNLQRAPVAGERLSAVHCQAGQHWRWDGVDFTFLHPSTGYEDEREENNHSCVLRIRSGNQAALLTGDIERESEAELVNRYGGELQAGLMIVPHHGSASSSSKEFLATVKPRLALVGAGYKNRWSFPKASVRDRYLTSGAGLLTTADWGSIEVEVDPDTGISTPRLWRAEFRRYWHATYGGADKSSNIAPLVKTD